MSFPIPALVVLRSVMMVAVAIAPIAWRWQKSPRKMLGFGAGAWFVTVALKVAWALPMNQLVHDWLRANVAGPWWKALFCGYVGSLTGIFEVGFLFFLTRVVSRFRTTSSEDAVAFGLGFGGCEAFVLAVAGLVAIGHPDEFTLASVLLGPLERAATTVVHLVCCALVLSPRSRSRQWRAFALAFVFKSAVDAAAVALGVGRGTPISATQLLAFESVLGAVALLGLLLVDRTVLREKAV